MNKIISSSALAVTIMLVSVQVAAQETEAIQRPNPHVMSAAEIKAFNATLPPGHRYFIICKRSQSTGSWAKKIRLCNTREELDRMSRNAQDDINSALEKGRTQPGCLPDCPLTGN